MRDYKWIDSLSNKIYNRFHTKADVSTLTQNHLPTEHKDKIADRVGDGPLADLFRHHEGPLIHKWLHYIPIYERYFEHFRNKPSVMLEIGISHGGSIAMWRRYFGEQATIVGIDINPDCADRVMPPNHVRIGSQSDPKFLRSIVEEFGPFDIILDDGSHIARHQEISFNILFPALKYGGLYVIEDLHTAYWPSEYHGGIRRPGTAIEMLKHLIDDIHHWYHKSAPSTTVGTDFSAIHFHDSIAVIEKAAPVPPQHIQIGEAF